MSNKNFYGTPHLNMPSRRPAGQCTKLVLDALRVPDANSLMYKFFLGLNEIIVVSKSFTGEQNACQGQKLNGLQMTTKRMVKRKKKAAY